MAKLQLKLTLEIVDGESFSEVVEIDEACRSFCEIYQLGWFDECLRVLSRSIYSQFESRHPRPNNN